MARIPTDNVGRIPTRLPGTPPQTGGPATPGRSRAFKGSGGKRAARDPLDLGGAFDRLRALLAFDAGEGPRDGVPKRGYYLNIIV